MPLTKCHLVSIWSERNKITLTFCQRGDGYRKVCQSYYHQVYRNPQKSARPVARTNIAGISCLMLCAWTEKQQV